jgi:hypothetical protein
VNESQRVALLENPEELIVKKCEEGAFLMKNGFKN